MEKMRLFLARHGPHQVSPVTHCGPAESRSSNFQGRAAQDYLPWLPQIPRWCGNNFSYICLDVTSEFRGLFHLKHCEKIKWNWECQYLMDRCNKIPLSGVHYHPWDAIKESSWETFQRCYHQNYKCVPICDEKINCFSNYTRLKWKAKSLTDHFMLFISLDGMPRWTFLHSVCAN